MKFCEWYVVIGVGLMIASCSAFPSRNLDRSDRVQFYADKYKVTKSEHQKLLLCIDAINEGVIQFGEPVKNLDRIFGTNLGAKLPSEAENTRVDFIYFGKFHSIPNHPDYQGWRRCWCLVVKYNCAGVVEDAYLRKTLK